MLVGKIQVGQGVGLGLFQHLGRLGAKTLYLGGGELVKPPRELGVVLGEHDLRDARHAAFFSAWSAHCRRRRASGARYGAATRRPGRPPGSRA